MTSDGVLLIDSRTHRTQAQNRVAARERLIGLIQKAMAATGTSPDETAEKCSRDASHVEEVAGYDQGLEATHSR